jgi:hypothetical protein
MPAKAPSPPERTPSENEATDIPVRELPHRRPETEPPGDVFYDIYDVFDIVPAAETDTTYEPIDTRPRVRVYGCCLPITLGILFAFLVTAALVVNLVIGVL